MKSSVENFLLATLACCAVGMTGMVARREFSAPATAAEYTEAKGWDDIKAHGQQLGDAAGKTEIVVFSDYQCPFCRAFDSTLAAVQRERPHDLSIRMRQFPLESIHPYARAAALASECAGRQNKFAEYHRALFAKQDSIGHLPWTTLAYVAGVTDTVRFAHCMASGETNDRVAEDLKAGEKLNLSGTPTVFINGKRFTHAPSGDRLRVLLSNGH